MECHPPFDAKRIFGGNRLQYDTAFAVCKDGIDGVSIVFIPGKMMGGILHYRYTIHISLRVYKAGARFHWFVRRT